MALWKEIDLFEVVSSTITANSENIKVFLNIGCAKCAKIVYLENIYICICRLIYCK